MLCERDIEVVEIAEVLDLNAGNSHRVLHSKSFKDDCLQHEIALALGTLKLRISVLWCGDFCNSSRSVASPEAAVKIALLISGVLAATKSPTPLWAADQKSFVSD